MAEYLAASSKSEYRQFEPGTPVSISACCQFFNLEWPLGRNFDLDQTGRAVIGIKRGMQDKTWSYVPITKAWYELGPYTAELAERMTAFNPDSSWTKVTDTEPVR
jgi:hypothetical protein